MTEPLALYSFQNPLPSPCSSAGCWLCLAARPGAAQVSRGDARLTPGQGRLWVVSSRYLWGVL